MIDSLGAPDNETLCQTCGHRRETHGILVGEGGRTGCSYCGCRLFVAPAVPSEKEPEPLAFDVHRVVAMLLMLSRLFAGKSDQNKGKELVSIYGGDLAERQAEVATTCAQLANALPGLLATQSRNASLENSHSQALKDIEALPPFVPTQLPEPSEIENFGMRPVVADPDQQQWLRRSAVLHTFAPATAAVPSPTPPSNG